MPHRWSQSALIRKNQIESGLDITFHKVFLPIYKKLFNEYRPQNVIDIGTGTGHLAMYLREYCNKMTAIEPSKGMYDVALETLKYSDIALSNICSYNFKTPVPFDIVYSHMCVHTIQSSPDFFRSIRQVILQGGKFIFSIPHPCFYYKYKNHFNDSYIYMEQMSTSVDLTISKDLDNPLKNIPYFHRPISYYLNLIRETGFTLEKIIEVVPDSDLQHHYKDEWVDPRYCLFVCNAL